MGNEGPTIKNKLLAALPTAAYEQLLPKFIEVDLVAGKILDELDCAWFPTAGLVSLFPSNTEDHMIEAAMIGFDGAIGLPGISRTKETSHYAQVQIAGKALQIPADYLRAVALRSRELNNLLYDYERLFAGRLSQSLICYRSHGCEERLARWLLMAHDRISSDELSITHENIALALGISRGHLSKAAGKLQEDKLIQYMRGRINILNRSGLEKAACNCYQILHLMIDEFFLPDVVFRMH